MDHGFRRDVLDNAFQLRVLPHQIVLMGATIPDAMERYLVDQFEVNNYKRIPASIHRPELQLVIEDLEQNRSDLLATNRFIIFGTTLEDGNYLEERLGLPFYHADSDSHPISDEERRAIYRGWVAGKYIGFLASNSMGAGNDYWKVRFTIFYRKPFNFTLGEQQCGRAGRDGEPATNYFVCLKNGWKPSKKNDHPTYGDIPGRQALYYLIYKTDLQHPQSCYQYQITGFFDGKARTCADLGRERVCRSCADGKLHTVDVGTSAKDPKDADNLHFACLAIYTVIERQ
ncbi:hypothetical protein B0H14DRAFT_3451706 [Mycena olivaceomarginata]|nr:hypothetical protein B0H14DRAFT_3451706 [Mycena olivaceomarginata]